MLNNGNFGSLSRITPLISFFLISLLVFGCRAERKDKGSVPEIFANLTEKDLIPEGTAYDSVSGQVFISSMYKRKIVAIRKDGSYYDFIPEGKDGIWATLGMEVDPKSQKLYVLSSKGEQGIITRQKIEEGTWGSRLYCYDIPSQTLSRIYDVKENQKGNFCFNDLTLSGHGDVFITESISNQIFFLPYGKDSIEVFLTPQGYHFLNGLAFNTDDSKLYVTAAEGLFIVDMNSREYRAVPYDSSTVLGGIDGLSYYQNNLLAHQSTVLTRFFLTETGDDIQGHQVLDSVGLDGSTTGEMGSEGWYYYIGNSQIRSGIDYTLGQIKANDSLETIRIKRIRIE